MNNVCFASVEGFVGCISSCRNAAAVLGGTWAVIPRHGETPAAVLQTGLLILSSWAERYESILEERRGPIVLRWHSPILQSELAQEAPKIARIMALLDRGAISALAVSDPAFTTVLGRGVVFVPEVLAESEYLGVTPAQLTGVNISLFGAAHWRKNIFVQSAAFDLARRASGASNWTLHLSGQSLHDAGYDQWLKAARIPYVDHGWPERSGYLSLVAAIDVGLSATLSEGYCYVAADHVALGVPIVASPAIACLGDEIERTRPDKIDDVAGALSRALAEGAALSERQRQSLDELARSNAETARSALLELSKRARVSAVP